MTWHCVTNLIQKFYSLAVAKISDVGELSKVAGIWRWRQIWKFWVDNFRQDVHTAAEDPALFIIDVEPELENDQDLVSSKILCNEFKFSPKGFIRTNDFRTNDVGRFDRTITMTAHFSWDEANLVSTRIFYRNLEVDFLTRPQSSQVDWVLNLDSVLGSEKLFEQAEN